MTREDNVRSQSDKDRDRASRQRPAAGNPEGATEQENTCEPPEGFGELAGSKPEGDHRTGKGGRSDSQPDRRPGERDVPDEEPVVLPEDRGAHRTRRIKKPG